MQIIPYDLETLKNCFLAVYLDIANIKKSKVFVISSFKNNFNEYIAYLKELKTNTLLVSFNGLKFDSQVNTHILKNEHYLKNKSGKEIAEFIYNYAQNVIYKSNNKERLDYREKDMPFYECDLLALNNYDNPAKKASLKWLQFNMNWKNLMDMHIDHTSSISEKQLKSLLYYCFNDCLSTKELYKRNIEEIKLRIKLSKIYKKNMISYSEPKLSKTIFGHYLSKALNISEYELSKKRTFRPSIKLYEVILPYLSFKTKTFAKALSTFQNQTINGEQLKGSFSYELTYRGMPITLALGGIHGAKSGIYETDDTYIIKSADVKSYYPNLAIRNKWAPAHLPKKEFCELYENLYNERTTYPKSNPLNYVLKIVLNAAYGLSNDEHSFLKDSFYTMLITVNGQLLLCMLLEEVCETIPGARPVMINTDGFEVVIPKTHEQTYIDICKKWEKLTMLELEFDDYAKLIIPDVNNYLGIYTKKEISKEEYSNKSKKYPLPKVFIEDDKYYEMKTKAKGRFEIDKPLHKNNSYRIKRIAFYNFFVHNKSIEESLSENNNIFDWMAGVRLNSGWTFKQTCVTDGDLLNEELQKTVRYFIANKGCKIIKYHKSSGRAIKLEAQNCLEYVLLKYDKERDFKSYPIDIKFYERMIRKEIENILPFYKQETLF